MEGKAQSNNKKFSPLGKAIIAASLAVAFIISAANIGVYTWAKYHSDDSGKGVATVSADFFFLSNTLKTVNNVFSFEGEDYTSEAEAVDDEHNFDYIYASGDWDATTPYTFNIEMYNYENTLRYNAETLTYTLYAQMITEAGAEDTYTIIRYDDTHTKVIERDTLQYGKTVAFENVTLEGDNANKNYFDLIVNPYNSDDYTPAKILVYAVITSPDYIDVESYYLGGIFSPEAEKMKFSVEGEFDVEQTIENGAYSNWLEPIEQLSGFKYIATTEGEADAEQDIILFWNADVLDFDLHNSYYTEKTVLDSNKKFEKRVPIEYDGFVARGKAEEMADNYKTDGYTDYLIYHTVANRSSTFIFYKGDNWDISGTKIDDDSGEIVMSPADYDSFRKLAKVQLYYSS